MTVARQPPSGPAVEVEDTTDSLLNGSSVEGETASDALDTLEARVTEIEDGVFEEQFQGGANANATTSDSGLFGNFKWSFFSTGGSLSRATDNADYIGAYSVNATASNVSALVLSSSTTLVRANAYLPAQIQRARFVGIPDTGDSAGPFGAWRYGFGSGPATAAFGSDGIFFEVDRTISALWRVVARAGGVPTVVQTAVPYTAHALVELEMKRTATGLAFYIDDVLVAELATAVLPTALVTIGLQVEATAASAQSGSLDEVEFAYHRTLF